MKIQCVCEDLLLSFWGLWKLIKILKIKFEKKGPTKEFVCLIPVKIRQITTTKGKKTKKPVIEDKMCFSKINTNYIPIDHSNLLVFQYMQQLLFSFCSTLDSLLIWSGQNKKTNL